MVVGLGATGLGIVRSLAPHCRHLIGVESNRAEPGVHTRLCRVRLVESLSDPDALLEALIRIADELAQRPVLFLSADEHVVWAVERRAALARFFRFHLPSAAACEILMFKDRFLAHAAREGLPVPRGAFLPVDALAAGARQAGLGPPLIVKPANKAGAWERRGLDKAYIVHRLEDLDGVAARVDGSAPAVLVQEYVEGGDDSVLFCLAFAAPGLRAPVLFSGRKLLQWPPLRGSTAACEPVADPALEALTRDLLGALEVEGLASLEAKRGADGALRIIEPTVGRVDLQSALATLNGVNMPLIAYLAALGRIDEAEREAAAARRLPPVVWINEASMAHLARARALAPAQVASLAGRPKGFALSAWNDPLVCAAFLRGKLAELATRARAAAVAGWRRYFPAARSAISVADSTRA